MPGSNIWTAWRFAKYETGPQVLQNLGQLRILAQGCSIAKMRLSFGKGFTLFTKRPRRLLGQGSMTTKGAKLATVGFMMPADFPVEGHNNVHSRLVKYKETHRAQWSSFGLGWKGVAYRYRALTECDEKFTASVQVSNSPPPEERYRQGEALFGFFVNAVSVIECFFYSAHCMASILAPTEFPVSEPRDLRFSPETVASRFDANFPGYRLSIELKRCLDEPTYNEMRDIRNVLTHRGMPPRAFYRGGERNGMATMPANLPAPSDQWKFDLPVDAQTTASGRQWLSDILKRLIAAANDLCNREL